MSTKEETRTEPVIEPVTDPDLEEHGTEPIDPPEPNNPNRESAKYRKRAQEAETARDDLAEQLDAMRRDMITGIIESEHGITATAIWATGKTTADFLDDDGHVDRDKIREISNTAITELGLQQKPRTPRTDPSQGVKNSATSSVSWKSLLKDRN